MISNFLKRSTVNLIGYSLVLSMLGCTSQSNYSHFLNQVSGPDLFSNRAQSKDQMVVVLKLQQPALLSTVKVEDGKYVIDEELKKQILDEQLKAISDIKAISSDIQILFRYKMVMNGLAIVAKPDQLEKIRGVGKVSYVEGEGSFGQPMVSSKFGVLGTFNLNEFNSVKFIGADKVHKMMVPDKNGKMVPVDGTGMRVGIIDTGIDYTHAMMSGEGTEAAYKAIDPSTKNEAYPNKKVVGGIDLVGTKYNSASADFSLRIPKPDENPLDEAGHGTHVAGTVAGKGDGIASYDGVAPEAQLYAIKVFGATGSTGDAVVIAGLEYAADISGEGNPNDKLDVVNLSLGSSYGYPHILYNEAVANLSKGGTVVVASAGNSGPNDYIVGAPSVADDAISVAASVDNSEQNWKFRAVKFLTQEGDLLTEAVEAPIAKSIEEAGDVKGELVFVGIADQDLSEELKSQVSGKVALIDRGKVTFAEKIRRAQEAGAIGVVVANNQPGEPFKMGGDGSFNIPAIMISQALGSKIKNMLKDSQIVSLQFKTSEMFEKKELVDTITSFSSKGPRSIDGLIKPEISAPGQNVISAAMGMGNKSVQMSGTSMAAPHMAGVMALLKELHPNLSSKELKSLAMLSSKSINDQQGQEYPVSMQGAGRVQVDQAAEVPVVTDPVDISLGEQNLSSQKTVLYSVTIKNIINEKIKIQTSFRPHAKGISLQPVEDFEIAAGESYKINLKFNLDFKNSSEQVVELDGFVVFNTSKGVNLTVPTLAIAKKVSNVKAESLKVYSSKDDSAGALSELTIKNSGNNSGDVMVFTLLGKDERKHNNHSMVENITCDLQAAGYRVISKNIDGEAKQVLQVAVKLYQAQTTWNMCEVSVLIDKNQDGLPDQELGGIAIGNLPGLAGSTNEKAFASVLLDAEKARKIRKDFESAVKEGKPGAEDYSASVLSMNEMMALNHSTVAVVEAPIDLLAKTAEGQLSLKVAVTLNDESNLESDDFLSKRKDGWSKVSIEDSSQSYSGMSEKITLNPSEKKTLNLTKGFGLNSLLLLMPQNSNVYSDLVQDGQAQIISPQFQY